MNADVIVVGAGIVGSACAFELARRGLDVLVLDSQRGGATAAGMGHLLVLDENPAELALSAHSLTRWRQWGPRLPAPCAWRQNGTLWLAGNAEEMAIAEAKFELMRRHDIEVELYAASRLRKEEPALREGLSGALKVSADGIVYAPQVAAWLLEQGGGRISHRRVRVSHIEAPSVRLDGGETLQAEAIVLANGIHAPELCPELPIEPKKGHLLITDRYPRRLRHTLVELGYITRAHASAGTSVAFNTQQRPTGQLLVGSSRQFDTRDPAVEGAVLAQMLRAAVEFLPELAGLNAIRAWTGFRAASPDGLPLLGEHPHHRGLWLAVGHEGLGVTTAPASAELLSAQLFGERPPIDPAPYHPSRLFPPAEGGIS